jgi:ATP-dependent RNA helicase RhlE
VVNFDGPGQPEDYIHRVGRTARHERTGDAYTFVSPEEMKHLREIEKQLGKKIEAGPKPPPSKRELSSQGPGSGPTQQQRGAPRRGGRPQGQGNSRRKRPTSGGAKPTRGRSRTGGGSRSGPSGSGNSSRSS